MIVTQQTCLDIYVPLNETNPGAQLQWPWGFGSACDVFWNLKRGTTSDVERSQVHQEVVGVDFIYVIWGHHFMSCEDGRRNRPLV